MINIISQSNVKETYEVSPFKLVKSSTNFMTGFCVFSQIHVLGCISSNYDMLTLIEIFA